MKAAVSVYLLLAMKAALNVFFLILAIKAVGSAVFLKGSLKYFMRADTKRSTVPT